ncbi:MAG: PleD family two-component system response regulator [Ktedonobacterales bacterium]
MQQLRVLVVDHNPSARQRLHDALGEGYVLRFVGSTGEALAAVRQEVPDLLVSEVDLPDGDGLHLCEQVRGLPETEHLPIMLVTERASIQDKVAGFQAGADDYVVKPVDVRLFHARIRLLYRIKGIEHRNSA